MRRFWLAIVLAIGLGAPAQADIILGAFDFNSLQFGDTLAHSDGGTFAAANWLNVANVDPGSPAYLTGANFDTGIANIGLTGSPLYSIGYNTPIINGPGDDLGIVTARYSTSDTVRMDVSVDGGATSQGFLSFGPGLALASGVPCNYYYGGAGPYSCSLFVTPVDLSAYGLGLGASINQVTIGGAPELDLIRVAGFDRETPVPEPSTVVLLAAGLGLLYCRRSRTS